MDQRTESASPGASTAAARVRLPSVVAGLVVCVGVAAVVGSRPLGYWTEIGPGPGFFPFWLGVLLTALGTGWVVLEGRFLFRRSHGEEAVMPAGEDEEAPGYSLPMVVAIVASLSVLAACLEVVGYQLSMLVFLLFHLLVLGRRGLLLSTALAVAGSFGVFVVFTRLLTVPLPASTIPLLRDLGL